MSAIAQIAAVPGVSAVLLFDEAGKRLEESAVDRPVDDPAFDRAMRSLNDALITMARGGGQPSGLFARTSDGWMLLRRIATFSLLVVGRGAPRAAMLEVALAVLAARLQPARGHGRRVAAPTIPMALDRGPAVGLLVMKELLRVLSDHLGAAARVTLRNEIAALGAVPHTLTREEYPQLVDKLAARIANPTWQEAFRRDATALLTAISEL